MDVLPHSVLLHILNLLDDLADVARCRVAWKAFETVFPGLRSVDLQCTLKWYNSSNLNASFKKVFLDLVSKLEAVESVCIGLEDALKAELYNNHSHDSYLTGDFAHQWVPRVSRSLKSLSISDQYVNRPSDVLPLLSAYCRNLVNLKLECVHLSMQNMNPMLRLTSLTLEGICFSLAGDQLNEWFPNLQLLHFVHVIGFRDPKIHLLKLKTCLWDAYDNIGSLTLITPNLITLRYGTFVPAALHVEAPMLSQFYVCKHIGALTFKKFEKLKTLWLDIKYIGAFLSRFPVTKTLETLTLESRSFSSTEAAYLKLTLGDVFTVFPNVNSLRIKSAAWSEIEASLNPRDWEILNGRNRLKTISAYVTLHDPLLTFSSVACVLDQCVGLLEVSIFIRDDADDYDDNVSKRFMTKCMARWPGVTWKWDIWNIVMDEQDEPDISIETLQTI